MNKIRLSDEQQQEVVAKLRMNYCYDGKKGLLVNRKTDKELKGQIGKNGYIYANIHIKGKKLYVVYHRLIWAYFHCRFPAMQIDHINGIRTDNRIVNLRETTQTQNRLNMVHPWKPNKDSGYSGVTKKRRRWQISVFQKHIYFSDRREAFVHLMILGRRYNKI